MSIILLLLSSIFALPSGNCLEFEVGGDNGWTIPKKDPQFYNDWAASNRFNANDTLYFKYKKDSVMVVSEEEYKKCRTVHPMFFSNNGDTAFTLDRAGLFYFLSGVSGHCERGQKMIVKVLVPHLHGPPAQAHQDEPNNNDAAFLFPPSSSTILVLLTIKLLNY